MQLKELSKEQRLHLAHGAASGVAHMHKLGFIHRDIKSKNVLVAETEAHELYAKLCDFGEVQKTFAPIEPCDNDIFSTLNDLDDPVSTALASLSSLDKYDDPI